MDYSKRIEESQTELDELNQQWNAANNRIWTLQNDIRIMKDRMSDEIVGGFNVTSFLNTLDSLNR